MKPLREYLQKKYLWLLIPLLLLGVFLYHFVAAGQAERELDRTLQEIAADSDAGIQYSSIQISPFSGNIVLEDLNLFIGRHVERSQRVTFRFGYLTFLRLYFGDIESALNHDLEATIHLVEGTWRDRERDRQISADTLQADYRGNGWDLFRHVVYGGPLNRSHAVEVTGRDLSWSDAGSVWGALRTDRFRLDHAVAAGSPDPWSEEAPRLEMRDLTWQPPVWFREKYGFFIRGFNYPVDAIPLRSLDLEMAREGDRVQIRDAELITEHFRLNLQGYAVTGDSLRDTSLDSLRVTVSDYSEPFRTVLHNLQQLFQVVLPTGADSLALPLEGTLGNPSVILPPVEEENNR